MNNSYLTPDYRQRDYTIKEACQQLRMTRMTLYKFIREGKLESYKLGPRTIRITWESVTRARSQRFVPDASPHAGEAA